MPLRFFNGRTNKETPVVRGDFSGVLLVLQTSVRRVDRLRHRGSNATGRQSDNGRLDVDKRKLTVMIWGTLLILIPLIGFFVLLGGLPWSMLAMIMFLFAVATVVLK